MGGAQVAPGSTRRPRGPPGRPRHTRNHGAQHDGRVWGQRGPAERLVRRRGLELALRVRHLPAGAAAPVVGGARARPGHAGRRPAVRDLAGPGCSGRRRGMARLAAREEGRCGEAWRQGCPWGSEAVMGTGVAWLCTHTLYLRGGPAPWCCSPHAYVAVLLDSNGVGFLDHVWSARVDWDTPRDWWRWRELRSHQASFLRNVCCICLTSSIPHSRRFPLFLESRRGFMRQPGPLAMTVECLAVRTGLALKQPVQPPLSLASLLNHAEKQREMGYASGSFRNWEQSQ
ncbi:hypothetical protein VTK73DRAFT_3721 [Phialemonium thermophilum]|uniref:Uncharacterized protein n=1 Tax=Phialemonium thermophilum TaxID=223376 RepID=A0ABR3VFP2_9PEZI